MSITRVWPEGIPARSGHSAGADFFCAAAKLGALKNKNRIAANPSRRFTQIPPKNRMGWQLTNFEQGSPARSVRVRGQFEFWLLVSRSRKFKLTHQGRSLYSHRCPLSVSERGKNRR